jgi:predicted dehydrogenase
MRRIIQVGVGGMGFGWTDRVAESPRWDAAAYVDTNRKNLTAVAVRHGMPKDRCFTDLNKALQVIEADALLDVTPQQFRKATCSAALDHGLDVLSEKPLADTLRNAKAIVALAKKRRRTYMVAQNYRYQRITQTAKHLLATGKLGDLGYVHCDFHKGPHFGGFRQEMPYPLVLDMSIHHFDMMRCLLDADVRTVQAVSIDAPWNWNEGDATVMAQLEMSNGIKVNYNASWVSQGWETPWNAHWRFDGSKGCLLWEQDELFFSNKADSRRAVKLRRWPKEHQAHLLDAFADALDNGEEPETSGRRNLNSLATTFAVVRAIKQRRRVRVSELLK